MVLGPMDWGLFVLPILLAAFSIPEPVFERRPGDGGSFESLPVGHGSSVERVSSLQLIASPSLRPAQVGITQVGTPQASTVENGTAQVGTPQVGAAQVGLTQ